MDRPAEELLGRVAAALNADQYFMSQHVSCPCKHGKIRARLIDTKTGTARLETLALL
jgi:hypothetical protein